MKKIAKVLLSIQIVLICFGVYCLTKGILFFGLCNIVINSIFGLVNINTIIKK